MLVYSLVTGVDEGSFRAAVTVALVAGSLMFVGLVGAIVGSEPASLARWLLRRRD